MLSRGNCRTIQTALVVCCAVVLVVSVFGNVYSASNAELQKNDVVWLIFSPTNHSHQRFLVRRHLNISLNQAKNGHIYIALADLNDDGVKEIFAYIEIFDYCGQQEGCPLAIYKVENQKLKSLFPTNLTIGLPITMEINSTGRQKVIGVLPTKTMGWHDIANNRVTIWRWNGKTY